MNQTFSFRITPLDPAAVHSQVSLALKQRSELLSRQKYPRLWRMTDRLSRAKKAPPTVLRRRRRLRLILGAVDWGLGLFLLLPGLMDPSALLVPLLVGAVCFGFSTAILWRTARRPLGILSAFLSVVLCLGGLGNPSELGRFLPLGIFCLAVGIIALGPWKRKRTTAFDRAAERLLLGKDDPSGAKGVRVTFSEEGMSIDQENRKGTGHIFPYSCFELVLETEDLLLPVYDESIMILQKKDLLTGSLPELAGFLGKQTRYVQVGEQTDIPVENNVQS